MGKFKEWFEMYPPVSVEWDEWDKIDKRNKEQYPIRYYLNEVLIPNAWWPISGFFDKIRDLIRFGFIERLHMINTGLPFGYYDSDTRLLHGVFSILVDFVEIEKAWMEVICRNNYKKPWWKFSSRFRSRELGLKYLDWEISLTGTDDNTQGVNAQIIKDIYLWWVDIRPVRIDPYSLMEDLPDEKINFIKRNSERDEIYKRVAELEKQQYDEDSEMLKKLVDIRNSLWT